MRYDKGHKEATRRKIVEAAATAFREKGIEGIGVADVMAKAGLTHGGFYSHFASKEELVREAVDAAFGQNRMRRAREEGKGLEEMIRIYLRPEHRDHPESGCPAAIFGPEVSRQPKATRAVFFGRIDRMVSLIEEVLPGRRTGAARRKAALGIASILVGSLQLARTAADPGVSDQILEAGIEAACGLAKA